MRKSLIIIFFVLLADQVVKFLVKTNMFLGQEHPVFGDWFIIHFTENNGMAFGFELEWKYGKLFLSIFRIVAIAGIGWYLFSIIKAGANSIQIISFSLILAGAFGNIIDSALYGIIFSDSNYEIAQFLPKQGGYETFLHGKVVDMLYFPIIEGHFPRWFPIWGSEEFVFFRPIFNIADASITTGVFLIILFQSSFSHKAAEGAEKVVSKEFSSEKEGTSI